MTLQVINIQDGCGSSYKVALNSALEFGIMFNPNKNREEALVSNGLEFINIHAHCVRCGHGSSTCMCISSM